MMKTVNNCAIILFMKKIILASGSPRRRELMEQIGLDFEVITSDCDENAAALSPEETAASLSKLKCLSVADGIMNGKIHPCCESTEGYAVIGSDTIVALDGIILGKPSDEEDAFRMLELLSGNVHTVYTGVTICDTASGRMSTFTVHTDVEMYALDESEIMKYIGTGEPMDKAGAYGIQGMGAVLVKRINGDYFTVVGLPIAELARELKKFL